MESNTPTKPSPAWKTTRGSPCQPFYPALHALSRSASKHKQANRIRAPRRGEFSAGETLLSTSKSNSPGVTHGGSHLPSATYHCNCGPENPSRRQLNSVRQIVALTQRLVPKCSTFKAVAPQHRRTGVHEKDKLREFFCVLHFAHLSHGLNCPCPSLQPRFAARGKPTCELAELSGCLFAMVVKRLQKPCGSIFPPSRLRFRRNRLFDRFQSSRFVIGPALNGDEIELY